MSEEEQGKFNVHSGDKWVSMDGVLEYLSPSDKEQALAWIEETKATGKGTQEDFLERLSPAGREAFLSYKKLAADGGLPAVKAMYKRETGSEDLTGLRTWLETRRAGD